MREPTADEAPAIQVLTRADIPFCVAQTAREGWSSTAGDFAAHLAHDPAGCLLATVRGERAAMVTTTRYRATGWIGNLIVAPGHRGRGLGSLLMEKAISALESGGVETVRLEADPPGVNIYRRLSFVDEYDSPRFRLAAPAPGGTPRSAALAAGDLPALASFDAQRFGDDRSRLLALLLAAARAAFRVPARGALAGYLMVLEGARGLRVGPWVADEPEAARELLSAAVAGAAGRVVTLAVPGPNRAARELLCDAGFRETPSSLRMVRGPAQGDGRPEAVYALANGAVG